MTQDNANVNDSSDTEREPTTYEAQREAIEEMLNVQWSTNWTPLPSDAEGHVEQAFMHLTEARDIAERESQQQDTDSER